jgi:small-conductance mechanosensitive channel
MDPGILYAAVTIAGGLVLSGIAYGVIRWLKKRAAETATPLDDIILMAVGTPVVIAIIALSFYFALTRFDLIPPSLAGISTAQVINAVFILLGAWIVSSFFHNLIRTYGSEIAEKTDTDLNRLVPLLIGAVRYLIWFVAFLLILAVFQIDITVFLAGAGIAGIALALAAQDVLSNFLGGAIIAIDTPFRIGDRVRIDTFTGDVVLIGGRSTRIKTLDNRIITLPNSTVIKGVIINYSQPDPSLKLTIPFSVAYGSDMDRVTEILLAISREAAEKTPWVMTDPTPLVYFHEIGESALNGQLLLWTNNYTNDRDVLDWVNRRIVRRFTEEKIEMPFRQVDVWMRKS